ncbi:MAG: hypothetical protein KF680_05510 [Cryobacterium sp.]|nr:hypothetical protein [Cryobacterium sp.]
MTTTTACTTFESTPPRRRHAPAFDRFVATLGMSLLRWAQARTARRTLTHESHVAVRALETERAARELAVQRTAAMRGF